MRTLSRRSTVREALGLSLLALSCTPHPSPSIASHQSPAERRQGTPPEGSFVHPLPLRVVSVSTPDGGAPTLRLSLDPDGSVIAEGRLLARLSEDSVVSPQGDGLARFESDGTVRFARAATGRFEGADLVSPEGTRLRVSDDGAVVFVRADGGRSPARVRVEGLGRAAGERERRTAAVMVFLVMLGER